MSATVVVSPRGTERIHGGHPWIYRADIVEVSASGGDVVLVRGRRGRALGSALYSDRSQIGLRMLADGEIDAPEPLIRSRLRAALDFRQRLAIDASAYRL